MMFLKLLSRLGVAMSAPRWLISLVMRLRTGTRGVSVGVRVVVFDADGAVFLVRHSYMKGWFLPGGGVDRGEVPSNAACREVLEEAQIVVVGEPELHGILLNDQVGVPDYVCCYIVREWHWDSADGTRPEQVSIDGEIIEADFFALDALPVGTTPATHARLGEIVDQQPAAKMWVINGRD